MRQEFGTSYIDKYSERELLEKTKKLIPSLFDVVDNRRDCDSKSYQNFIGLLEIIKFSGEKYPYLLTLEFDKKKLSKVGIWKDPYLDISDERPTAFIGRIFSFCDLCDIAKKPDLLTDAFKDLLAPSSSDILNKNCLQNTICIVGTSEAVLNIGRARKAVFEKKLKDPVFFVTCKK